jgi:TusE/DsrC/DsvC family sulfur relay protein
VTEQAAVEIPTDVAFDPEGFMTDPLEWTPQIAEAIAKREGLTLTERHWSVINFARQEFEANGEPPTLRRITKSGGIPTKELYQLFPNGPAKKVAMVAGLGKPTGCL